MKYAINFTNHGTMVADMNDWKNNLTPYWIEHYFKDPRYMKIDGKPLFGVFEPNLLDDQVGDAAAAIRYLRQACVEAGLPGIIVLAECRRHDEKVMTQLKKWGFEATYAYCWGCQDLFQPEEQMNALQRQKDYGKLDVLFTASMGWDLRGWAGEKDYFLKSDEFQRLLQKGKDDFMSSYPKDRLASRLLMLDNWNEFGEGHFIIPTKLYGFGYVNAIRNVFGSKPFPENVAPNLGQKERITTLYPKY